MAECLYIHIPFCVRKCVYCDFLSVPFDETLVEPYIGALCRELDQGKDSAAILKTVYIGGGTPSILPRSSFSKLFRRLREAFSIAPAAEITVEANPGTVSADALRNLRDLGVNRISMGVQSFADHELQLLGRIHSAEDAVRSAGLISGAGIRNFSIDLMYGIPGQTLPQWRAHLSRAVDLGAPHVSAYELTLEHGTPLHRSVATGVLHMPDESEIMGMFDATAVTLAAAGIEHYEISNYARPGRQCRHNINYWERGEYLAAGAGAHSFIDGVRSRNVGEVKTYIERLQRAESPVAESVPVGRDEAIRETLFLGLRMTSGISLQRLAESGADVGRVCADLIEDGYLLITGDSLRLTRRGMALSNAILVKVFQRLGL